MARPPARDGMVPASGSVLFNRSDLASGSTRTDHQKGSRKAPGRARPATNVSRLEVADRIRTAKEFGDISENSEYEDAKNDQGWIEGRILTLEKMIRNAEIIHETRSKGTVVLGSKVKVKDEFGETSYTIVGPPEADPAKGLISSRAPWARRCWDGPKGTRSRSRPLVATAP